MAALAVPGFPLGLGGPPPPGAAAAAPPPGAAAGPVVAGPPAAFSAAIIAAIEAGIDPSGYEVSYPVYIASLEPSLIHEYSDPRARRDPVPAAAVAAVPGGDPVAAELVRIKAYLNDPAHPDRRPPGMDNGRVNALVNRARDSGPVAALGRAAPFDVAAYRVAVLANLNGNAPAGFNFPGVGP